LESECDFVVDINMIGVYKTQIKYYEIMMNQSNASGDIQWYKSQIKKFEQEIEILEKQNKKKSGE
jgi:hypothetical protein